MSFTSTAKTHSEDEQNISNSGNLTDGVIGGGGKYDKESRYAIDSNSVLTWTFPSPCEVDEVRVYNIWNDNGRDQIAISSVDVQLEGQTDWLPISASSVSYNDPNAGSSTAGRPRAFLAMSDGSPLATRVTALRIVWGTVENGWVGCGEIEVEGR